MRFLLDTLKALEVLVMFVMSLALNTLNFALHLVVVAFSGYYNVLRLLTLAYGARFLAAIGASPKA